MMKSILILSVALFASSAFAAKDPSCALWVNGGVVGWMSTSEAEFNASRFASASKSHTFAIDDYYTGENLIRADHPQYVLVKKRGDDAVLYSPGGDRYEKKDQVWGRIYADADATNAVTFDCSLTYDEYLKQQKEAREQHKHDRHSDEGTGPDCPSNR